MGEKTPPCNRVSPEKRKDMVESTPLASYGVAHVYQ